MLHCICTHYSGEYVCIYNLAFLKLHLHINGCSTANDLYRLYIARFRSDRTNTKKRAQQNNRTHCVSLYCFIAWFTEHNDAPLFVCLCVFVCEKAHLFSLYQTILLSVCVFFLNSLVCGARSSKNKHILFILVV